MEGVGREDHNARFTEEDDEEVLRELRSACGARRTATRLWLGPRRDLKLNDGDARRSMGTYVLLHPPNATIATVRVAARYTNVRSDANGVISANSTSTRCRGSQNLTATEKR